MNKYKILFIFFAIAILLIGCSGPKEVKTYKMEGFALGTVWSVTVAGDMPEDMRDRIEAELQELDASMSVFNPNSTISRLNNNESDVLDEHVEYCIEVADRVSRLSAGRYDITVLPLVEAYGFAAKNPEETVNVDSLLQFVGYEKIAVKDGRLVKSDPRIRLDINSVAKGYIVDLVSGMLDRDSISNYLVNIGGEIFARGTNHNGKTWGIGIETPSEGNYTPGASIEQRIEVSGKGVATSGNYRNFRTDAQGRKFTHIVNPITGESTASNLLSATVVAGSCAEADALGTMFIALGLEGSLSFVGAHPETAVLLIFAENDGSMQIFTSGAMRPYLRK